MIELNMNHIIDEEYEFISFDEGYEFIWSSGAMNDMNSYVCIEVWIHNIWIHTKDVMVQGKNRKVYTGLSWCSRIVSWSHALGDRLLRLCRLCVFVHLIWRALRHGRVGGGPCSGGHGECIHINSLTAKSCYGGEKHLNPVGFYSRNSTKSTLQHKHNNYKHHHHGGAVCPSYGVGSMDTPDRTHVTSCKGAGRGGGVSVLIKSINF